MGKLDPGTYFLLEYAQLDELAHRGLSSAARVAYLEFRRLYNQHNNGNLLMSAKMLAVRLGCGKSYAAEALHEMIDKGRHRNNRPAVVRGETESAVCSRSHWLPQPSQLALPLPGSSPQE